MSESRDDADQKPETTSKGVRRRDFLAGSVSMRATVTRSGFPKCGIPRPITRRHSRFRPSKPPLQKISHRLPALATVLSPSRLEAPDLADLSAPDRGSRNSNT
jgi:hypothetical protein